MHPGQSHPHPVARGDELEVEIEALGEGPDGIARVGDYVVFVPGVLPGERAAIRITSAARKFGRGELLTVLRTAPERVPARCPHFLSCGGCQRQHQSYAAQLTDKQQRVQRAVERVMPIEVAPTIAAVPPFGQRAKVAVHLRSAPDGRLETCFHRMRSPELVAVRECPASRRDAWDLAMRAVALLEQLGHEAWDPDFAPRGLLRSVLVRTTSARQAHVLIVARQAHVPGLDDILDDLHAAGATTIAVNGNDGEFSRLLGPETRIVSGPARIEERLAGFRFLLSPGAFFQTSPQAAEHVVRLVVDWLRPGRDDDVADLYCGVGLLTLPLARTARSVLGVELSRNAITDATVAARENGLTNVQWRSGHVHSWLRRCGTKELPRPHLVALDPPRTGLEPEVVAELVRLQPRRIAYVSCDTQALRRDLQALAAAGYRAGFVQPVDMFPQTAHIEAVIGLERGHDRAH